MLQTRRLLAFSSRVHTYTLLLYLFFFLVYIASSFFCRKPGLCGGAVAFFSFSDQLDQFAFWILDSGFLPLGLAGYRVFPASAVLLTVLRMIAVFALSLIVALLEHVITRGELR